MVILGDSKEALHKIRYSIQTYLRDELKLELSNYQVFPISKRDIDFVGYRHYYGYTLLRKSIKNRFLKMLKYSRNKESIASYNGWLVHSNSINLINKHLR